MRLYGTSTCERDAARGGERTTNPYSDRSVWNSDAGIERDNGSFIRVGIDLWNGRNAESQ